MPPVYRTLTSRLAAVLRIPPCRPAGRGLCRRQAAVRALGPLLLAWVFVPAAAQHPPAPGCAPPQREAHRAVQGVQRELLPQGLAIRMRCTGSPQAASWAVEVRVVDGWRASAVVRGPLADGEVVDMGTASGEWVQDAPAQGAQRYSPDVQHNRAWLQSVMARHRFARQPGGWWHYALSGAAVQETGPTPLALR